MQVKWTSELELVWRNRLRESKGDNPFHAYIQCLIDDEIEIAFSLALDELERLRKTNE